MFPYRFITAVSLGGAYILSSGRIPQWPVPGFLAAFIALWGIQLFAWAVWAVLLYPKLFSPLRGLPEPAGNSWFMGQFPVIRALPSGTPMAEWAKSIPNDGVIRYLGPFNQERLLITSPKALAEVLVTKNYDFIKPSVFRFSLGRVLGVGLLLAEGDEHKMQRRNLMPAFAFRHVKELYPVFWAKARQGVRAMTEQILQNAAERPDSEKSTGVVEVGGWASRITLDIIGLAGLGCDFDSIGNPTSPLNEAYTCVFSPSRQSRFLQLLGIVTHPRIASWLPVKRNGEINEAVRMIRAECERLIREKKEKHARKELTDQDILSVAIESGGFSDENLVDQLMTFLAAGHETTAAAVTWAAYLLAKHPEMQDRLRAEIREYLPSLSSADDDSTISSSEIDRMPYLNAVCNEVLRYLSPVPMTLREAACDTSIQGHFVPKGTRIVLAPWAINKLETLWGGNAGEFNPDRWIPQSDHDKHAASGGATSNYAFMTFLHGPRSCIGQSFAKGEFACLLAWWVGRFRFELHNEEDRDEANIKIASGVTARPRYGMYLRTTVLD
ncbi:449293f5-5c5d-43c7-b083-661d6d64f506 [Thermothielavioides terrestris]|uniref:449293f5-5c5d-43c7-b083-661d6d64f506 n=1 Tax=Thermothielavioides terrestris TaxID=2587410 RepID=A0A446B8R8_9PEZI|nr:449293f5-5c5d-43c7-b083-661d6d64f506 [Thermothielavioides terrestris]